MGAHRLNRLSAATVKHSKGPCYLPDGGGLYLRVSKTETKSWVQTFTLCGKSREMGLGPYPEVTLEQARVQADANRQLLRGGIDPIAQRDAAKAARRLVVAKAMTFKEAAEAYIKSHSDGWKNAKHAAQWTSTLEQYAYPLIGELDVKDVETGLVIKVLDPIWKSKTETANRVRSRLELILSWATTHGLRTGENPARWRGHIQNLLPKPSKISKVEHHPALDMDDVQGFLTAVGNVNGMGARALEFAILTATRSGEVRGATWGEVDLEKEAWLIPAARMKANVDHRVPLSMQAMDILRGRIREIEIVDGKFDPAKDEVVFKARSGGTLSDMTLTSVIRRLNDGKDPMPWIDPKSGEQAVPHGFRSTFRDWASERTSYPREVAEQALAHKVSNQVEAAYLRGDLFTKRRKLMEQWGTFATSPAKQDVRVVGINEKRAAS
jgi:integrase